MQQQSEMLHHASPLVPHRIGRHHHHMSLEDSILASSPERHIDHHTGEILNSALAAVNANGCSSGSTFDPSSIPHLDLEMVDQPSIATSCPTGLDLQARVDLTTHLSVPDFDI